tara:strand:- start:337 stop:567 length:231 start_codon:yes stop_codon:yes gene_type:complete
MITDEQKSDLLRLAAEMIRGDGMPFEFVDDWNLPESTTTKVRREIAFSSSRARRKAHAWGRRLVSLLAKEKQAANK